MALIPISEQVRNDESVDFIGKTHGSQVSFFWEAMPPGMGPALHRHPYSETFIVLDGQVIFTLGSEEVTAVTGDIAVAQALMPHRFVNSGDTTLRMVNIHAAAEMETDWLDPVTWEVVRTSYVRA